MRKRDEAVGNVSSAGNQSVRGHDCLSQGRRVDAIVSEYPRFLSLAKNHEELRFLAIEHGFRLATEPGTRDGGFGVGKSYWNSVFNLHDGRTAIPFTSTMSAIP